MIISLRQQDSFQSPVKAPICAWSHGLTHHIPGSLNGLRRNQIFSKKSIALPVANIQAITCQKFRKIQSKMASRFTHQRSEITSPPSIILQKSGIIIFFGKEKIFFEEIGLQEIFLQKLF
jgi:hypothetical protein